MGRTVREAELGRRRARDGTDGDVLAWIEATFGVRIPAVACCPGHVAPAQAFCDALRARDQVALWIASRGFGGKTFPLALLAAANAILFETDVIILGGSGQQSLRVVEQLHGLWAAGQVPPAWLASAPTFTKTTLAWGNMIQALTASQPAVRGAHPTRLLLDEIDEMKLPILEAAQGQPMDRNGVQAQTVMSSTQNKRLVLELTRSEYLDRRENVLALGNSGTGKTHLALALGLAACQKGYRVRFTTAAALVNELLEARDEKRLLRLQKQLAKQDLLIVDELGYVPLSKTGAELLFEIFSQRYEQASTLVTSNLPFNEWTEIFGSERLTGALLDRLTHHVHILELNGDSYRLEHSKKARQPAAAPAS